MNEKNIVLKPLEEMVQGICENLGLDLYDIELKTTQKGKILLVFLSKMGGVTIDDCTGVSKALSANLDESDLIDGKYFLEVSSTGLERKLKLKKHFISAIGESVKITFAGEKGNKTVKGILKNVLPDEITLEADNTELNVRFKDIKKAETFYNFKKQK